MRREMRGESVERSFEQIIVGDICRARGKTGQPCRALPVVPEQAVYVSAEHPAVGRNRAFRRAIREMRERPRAIRPRGDAHMHLVAGKRRAVAGRAMNRLEAFIVGERGRDIEEAETCLLYTSRCV